MTCLAPARTANLWHTHVSGCGLEKEWVVEHAEDGCTASNVEDDLVLEKVAVLVYRVAVALGTDFIFLHIRR